MSFANIFYILESVIYIYIYGAKMYLNTLASLKIFECHCIRQQKNPALVFPELSFFL